MKRRWLLALLLLGGALIACVVTLHTPTVRSRLAAWAIGRLRSDYRVNISVGRVDYNLFSLTVQLRDLVAASADHPDAPFFRARELAVDLPWTIVWNRSDAVDVQSLRLGEPRISIQRFRDGRLNLPAPRGPRRATTPLVRFGTLAVDRLDVSYVDQAQDLRLETRAISFSLRPGRSRQIEGPFAVEGGPHLTLGRRAIRGSRFAGTIAFDGRALEIREMELVIPQGRVTVNGRIDRLLAAPTIDARVEGRVNLGALSTLAFPDTGAANNLHGALDMTGRLTGELISPVADLGVLGRSVRWRDITAAELQARGRLSTREAVVQQIRARLGNGWLEARGRWPFETGAPKNLSASWQRVDATLLRSLVPALPYRLAASLDGDLDLNTARVDLAATRATIRNRAVAARDRSGIPIDGSLVLQLDRGAWRLQQTHQVAEGAKLDSELHGRLAARLLDSTVEGTSNARISRPDATATSLRRAGIALPDVLDRVQGEIEGTFQVAGRIERPKISGSVQSRSLSVQDTGPFAASAAFASDTRGATIDRLEAHVGKNVVIARGTMKFSDGAIHGRVEASLNELPVVAALVGVPPAWEPAGTISLTGSFGGTLGSPSLAANIDGRLSVAGQALDRVSGRVDVDGGSARLSLGVPLFGATADGLVDLARPYQFSARGSSAQLDVTKLPLDWLRTRRTEGVIDLTGSASGALDRPADIKARVDIAPFDLRIDQSRVRLAAPTRLEYSGQQIALRGLRLQAESLELNADGSIGSPSDVLTMRLRGDLRDLGPLAGLETKGLSSIEGKITLDATARGALEQPEVEAWLSLESGRIPIGASPSIDEIELRASYAGGIVQIERARASWQDAIVTASGEIPARTFAGYLPDVVRTRLAPDPTARLKPGTTTARAEGPAHLDLRVENITSSLLAGALAENTRRSIAGSASLAARFDTDALDLEQVKGAIAIESGAWSIQGIQFEPVRPPHLTLSAGRLLVDAFEWKMLDRPENRLSVSGGADLEPARLRLDARVTGTTDLRVAGAFLPEITTFGDAALDVRVTGPPDSLRVDGQVRIAGAGLTLPDPALAVTDLRGTLHLSETKVTTQDLEGRANGGIVTARGTFDYGLLSPTATTGQATGASLTIAGRGLGLDFPAGLQSEADVDVTLRVEETRPRLSGNVKILRGEYRRPLSLVTQLLGSRLRSAQPSDTGRLVDRLELDLRIVTDADVQVDNNYGRFDLGGDLRLVGSIGRPGLVGRAEMREGGQMFLGGTVYLIDRGSIDFSNRTEIEPDLDVSARTHVAGHEITLTISGTPDRLSTDLTADDPALAKADIVSLLLTGRLYSEVTSQQASESGQQLLGLLSGEVLGVAGRAVGLDTLRFERGIGGDLGDLGDVASETDPTARLTLAKNLSPEVRLLLSQHLTRSGGLTWIVSYQPRPQLDVRAVARDNRDRAYQVRHQVSFGGPNVRPAARLSTPRPRVEAVRIIGTPGFPETVLVEQLRLVAGHRFDFRQWRDDRDRLTRFYGDAGYLEARIVPRRVAGDNNAIVLEYEIEPGPHTQLAVDGARLSRRASDAIRSAWIHSVFDRFLEEEAAILARIDLVRDGFLQAQVRASMDRLRPDEKRLVVSVDPGVRRTQRGLGFQGNHFFSTRDLTARAAADDIDLEAWIDPAAMRQWLTDLHRSAGFLAVKVRVGAVQFPAPASAILPVAIEEGPKYRIGDIRLEGVNAVREADVRRAFALSADHDFTPIAVDDARQRVERLYRRLGFNDASVRPSATTDPANASVDLALVVQEGPEQRLERTEIEGLERTRRDVVERALGFEPGTPVDVSQWQRGRKRLYDTGVFRRVDIEPVLKPLPSNVPADQPQPVIARVMLEERPPWRIRYGVQLNDETKPASEGRELSTGLVAELLDRNLFGRAATAGSTFRYDRRQKLARAFVSTPQLFGLAATTSLFLTRSREEQGVVIPILVDKASVSVEQRVHPLEHLDVTYGYSLERNHTFNPRADPNDPLGLDFTVRIARLTGTAVVDTRDDPFEATRGSFHSSSLEYAPGALGSDLRFVKFLAQQTYFRSTHQVVLASSARLGMGRGFGQELIASEQFLAGGGNSVRGYEEDAIGGRDVLDQPVGGNAMVVLNQEVRFPLYKWIRGVGFVDAGNVFGSAAALGVFDLKVATGVGLRVTTPFALLRVDFGVPLSDRTIGTRRGRWYFSIGQMF